MIDPLVIRQEQRSYETGMFQITSDNDDDDIDDAYNDDNTNDDAHDEDDDDIDDNTNAGGRCIHHAPGPHLA